MRIVTKTEERKTGYRAIKEISNIDEIYIQKLTTTGGESRKGISNGETFINYYYDDGTDRKIIIDPSKPTTINHCRLNIRIWIKAKGPEVTSGEIYFYRQHEKTLNDSYGYEPLKAVIAHEKGHAQAYWDKVIPKIKAIVNQYKSTRYFTRSIKRKIRKKIQEITQAKNFIFYSIKLSNAATRKYFDSGNFIRKFPKKREDIGKIFTKAPYNWKSNLIATDIWKAK